MYSNSVSLPSCWPSWPNQVLTELVSAVSRAIAPKSSPKSFASGVPFDFERARRVDRRFRRDRAAVQPGRGGHDLEGRARRVEALGRPVEQRRFDFVGVQLLEFVGDPVRVVRRVRGHHLDRAGARFDRDHGAEARFLEVGQRDPLRFGVDVGDDVVAFLGAAEQLVEDRAEFRFFADQLVVVELLELGVAVAARSCSRSGGRRARLPGSGGRSAARRPCPSATDFAITVPSAARMRPRGICCCSSSGRLLASFSFSAFGVEDRPVGREADQDAEEDDDEGEQFDDLPVHAGAPSAAHPARRFGRFTPGPVGDQQQQRQQHEVGDDRAAAVADEGQGDAGQRDHPGDAADDHEGLDREDRGQPGRQQLREAVAGQQRDLEAAGGDQQVDEDDAAGAEQAELVDDQRVDRVGLRRRQQRAVGARGS